MTIALLLLLAGTIAAGLFPLPKPARWALAAAVVISAERLTAGEPALFRMLAVIALLFAGMKVVIGAGSLPPLRWLAFNAWPGMRPDIFANRGVRPHDSRLLEKGAVRFVIGLAIFLAARELDSVWLALPGLSLMLHFGIFNLAAGAWRAVGVDVDSLFRAPLYATTLSEFWGRRWNLAFSEMTAAAVYRPLGGGTLALIVAFAFSGLLHELAISVPVRAGFGLPMAYFALHGALVVIERRMHIESRVWTAFWILAPLPILFHAPFLEGVVRPLL